MEKKMSHSHDNKTKLQKINSVIDKTVIVLAWGSGGMVLLMAVVTALDVLARKILPKPFTGAIEITEYMLALAAFLGAAYTAATGYNVRVDVILKKFSTKTVLFLETVASVVFMFFTLIIIWSQ